jgi:hypothetical protein
MAFDYGAICASLLNGLFAQKEALSERHLIFFHVEIYFVKRV